ncbi:response regulator [Cupriavidus basilensis]
MAEDNAINGTILKEQLEQIGCVVALACDGVDALARWHTDRFLMAWSRTSTLPKGKWLLRIGRSVEATRLMRALLSDHRQCDARRGQRCMDAGMTSWLVKPFDLGVLRSHLQSIRSPAVIRSVAQAVPEAPASHDEVGFVLLRFRNGILRDHARAISRRSIEQ